MAFTCNSPASASLWDYRHMPHMWQGMLCFHFLFWVSSLACEATGQCYGQLCFVVLGTEPGPCACQASAVQLSCTSVPVLALQRSHTGPAGLQVYGLKAFLALHQGFPQLECSARLLDKCSTHICDEKLR